MAILILEDDHRRMRCFRRYLLSENDVIVVTSVKDFKSTFGAVNVEAIFLDHDLVPMHYGLEMHDDAAYLKAMETVTVPTGFHAAQWLAENTSVVVDNTPIVTHTQNPAGGRAICRLLPTAKHIPMPDLERLAEPSYTGRVRDLLRGIGYSNG